MKPILTLAIIFCYSTFSLPAQINTPELATPAIQFSANLIEEQVEVYWTLTTEIECEHFTLQRSLEGKHWENLLQIEAGNEVGQYKAKDLQPYEGTSQYRIVLTDYDGNKITSDIQIIHYEVPMERVFMSQRKLNFDY